MAQAETNILKSLGDHFLLIQLHVHIRSHPPDIHLYSVTMRNASLFIETVLNMFLGLPPPPVKASKVVQER